MALVICEGLVGINNTVKQLTAYSNGFYGNRLWTCEP
jgi:hypothetical protein